MCLLVQHVSGPRSHFYPGVPVPSSRGPGVGDALVVEAGQLWAPALQAQYAIVDGGGRDLGLHDAPALHAQQGCAA